MTEAQTSILSETRPTGRTGSRSTTRRERSLLALAGVFVAIGAATLWLDHAGFGAQHFAVLVGSYAVSFALAHAALSRWLPERDPVLLPVAALLTGIGLLLLGRLARNFLIRQAVWLPLSVLALLGVVRFRSDLRWLRRYRYTWLVGGLGLLAATLLLGVNPSGYGPRLWLGGLGVYFQPSELLKLLMVVFMSSYLAERRELIVSEKWKIGRWRVPPLAYVGPLLAMFGIAMVILAWQQDLGAAMLFFLTFLGMLYLATGQVAYPAVGFILLLGMGVVGYFFSDLVRLRVDSWWRPWPEASGRAFQIVQSLLAYGAGGIIGEGLGLGSPALIPAVHTDFAHAAIAEEFGLLGALAIVSLYVVAMFRGFRIAVRARSGFGQLLASGLTIGFAVQAWVIMAGNAKLAPITGVTLPFVSYGGSSLLASCLALGLLLRVSGAESRGNHLATSSVATAESRDIRDPLMRTAAVLTIAFSILAAGCGYWAVVRAQYLAERDDNLRPVLREQRIVRGRILDRDGAVLADVDVAENGVVTRRYPTAAVAPALGYSSVRYGTAGIEAALDATLRGESEQTSLEVRWAELLHRTPQGADVQLTLDTRLQRLAQGRLAEVQGAAVVIDVATGEILVLASSPTFDPARLDEEWEQLTDSPSAPLLNRATQGLYQPGTVFHTVVLAEALARNLVDLGNPYPGSTKPIAINGVRLQCDPRLSAVETLADAYERGCPAPIADLAESLGPDGLVGAVERWGLTTPPPLEIPALAGEWDGQGLVSDNAMVEALGQGELVVSPLQVAIMVATLGAGGDVPQPHLVLRVQDSQGRWHDSSPSVELEQRNAISSPIARELLGAWTADDQGRILYRSGTAVAGQAHSPHVWFTGLTRSPHRVYAVVVLVENPTDPELASDLGKELLIATAEP